MNDPSQRKELMHLLKLGVQKDELSVAISLRGGTQETRRVLADALMQNIMEKYGPPTVQECFFCMTFIASTCGRIYISAPAQDHVCNENCFWFIKEKGHAVIYIDCGRMQTETERLADDLKKLLK